MKTFLRHDLLGTLCRAVLAGVLLYAGLTKLSEPDGARTAILAYRLFPVAWADVLGYALPAGEVALGLLLLVGLFVRLAGLLTGLLMLGFVLGILSVWVRGYSIDCGCFGGGGDVSAAGKAWRYSETIARDLLLAGMALRLAVWPSSRWALEAVAQPSTRRTDTADSVP